MRPAYVLDLTPSPRQRMVLERLARSFDLVLSPSGYPVIRQTGEPVLQTTVDAMLRRDWIDRHPGFPLFDEPVRLTRRGRCALGL